MELGEVAGEPLRPRARDLLGLLRTSTLPCSITSPA